MQQPTYKLRRMLLEERVKVDFMA